MEREDILEECKKRFKDGDVIQDSWGDKVVVNWSNVKADDISAWVDTVDNIVFLYENGIGFSKVIEMLKESVQQNELLSRIEKLESAVDELNEKVDSKLSEVEKAEPKVSLSSLKSMFPDGYRVRDSYGDECIVDWSSKSNQFRYDGEFELISVYLGNDVLVYSITQGVTAQIVSDNK